MLKRLLATSLALVATVALASGAADIDYSDFDDDLMRNMDDAIKELDSNVGGQDAQASLANARVLSEGLAWAEKYFAAKPEAPKDPKIIDSQPAQNVGTETRKVG